MLQFLLWFFRVVVIGQKRLPVKQCLLEGWGNCPGRKASSICGTGLCVSCCANNCRCLAPLVKQTRELQC